MNTGAVNGNAQAGPAVYLATPYELVVDSVRRADGEWVRRAAYPELGCAAEDADVLAAIDALDRLRTERISALLAAGEPVPAPRAPLKSGLDAGFAAGEGW
jgi:hypothetical protein